MTSQFLEPTTFADVRRTVMVAFESIVDEVPRSIALGGLFDQALQQIADGHPDPAAVAAAVLGRP